MRRLLLLVAVALALGAVVSTPHDARATVTTTYSPVTYSPSTPTTVFTVTFPFTETSQIKVTKTTIASGATVVLTQGTDYSVRLPVGSTSGRVTTAASVTSTHRITIERVVPITQTTSFRTQGRYQPESLENAVDKLTMIAQQLSDGTTVDTDIDAAIDTHEAAADPHAGYALLAGRAGGQHLKGGTASAENLQLSSTAHATKGKLLLGAAGTSAFVETTSRLGIGTASPSLTLDIVGDGTFSGFLRVPTLYGSASSGGDLTLYSTAHATKGNIFFGTSTYDEVNNRLGLATTSPSVTLDVVGQAKLGAGDQVHFATDGEIYKTVTDGSITIYGGTSASPGAFLSVIGPGAFVDSDSLYLGATNIYVTDTAAAVTAQWLDLDTSTPALQLGGSSLSDYRSFVNTVAIAETVVDSSCPYYGVASTDNTIVQLPDAASTNKGCTVTIVNTAADGAALISISPHASDTIEGSCVGTTGAGAATVINFGGVANKDIQNTKATQQKGDYATVMSDGTSAWYVIGCVGQWASQP
jgi:hypothetical protein